MMSAIIHNKDNFVLGKAFRPTLKKYNYQELVALEFKDTNILISDLLGSARRNQNFDSLCSRTETFSEISEKR